MASAFSGLEERGDLAWHIDAKDKDPRPEERRQSAVLRDARMLCPGVDIFAVPNGGKRTQWAQMKAKREGMKAGVLDLLCLWWPNQGAMIEVKRPGGRLSDDQKAVHEKLSNLRWPVETVDNIDDAYRFLRKCGAPCSAELRAAA